MRIIIENHNFYCILCQWIFQLQQRFRDEICSNYITSMQTAVTGSTSYYLTNNTVLLYVSTDYHQTHNFLLVDYLYSNDSEIRLLTDYYQTPPTYSKVQRSSGEVSGGSG